MAGVREEDRLGCWFAVLVSLIGWTFIGLALWWLGHRSGLGSP